MEYTRIYTCRRKDGRVVKMWRREDGWYGVDVSTDGDRWFRTKFMSDTIAPAYRAYNEYCAQ